MKPTSLSTKLILAALLIAVVFYFGVEAYRYLVSPTATTIVYRYNAEEAVGLKGFVVRDEQVVECSETQLELTHAEGERVAAGKALATIYHSEQALADVQELETLNAQLELLQYAYNAKSDTESSLKLDGDIRNGIVALRAAMAADSYTAVDELTYALKTTVLKREIAYGSDEELSGRIDELKSRTGALSASLRSATSTVAAPFAGTYSAVADGYETVLTPGALNTMTVEELENVRPKDVSSTVGKLISGTTWYYAAPIPAETAAALSPGEKLSLRMASGVDFDLDVTVSRIGREERGQCLLVLASDRSLPYVTLLREQNAELVLKSYTGLRIPKNALRVGEDGKSGVYCLVGLTAHFKPVNVLYQGSDYCLVEPGEIDAATESQVSLYTLRPSDEVIISAGELYNGKVVD